MKSFFKALVRLVKPDKPLSEKIEVKLDDRTTIYVDNQEDVEKAKRKYLAHMKDPDKELIDNQKKQRSGYYRAKDGKKICNKCFGDKSTEEFGSSKLRPDGFMDMCSACDKKYRAKRKKEKASRRLEELDNNPKVEIDPDAPDLEFHVPDPPPKKRKLKPLENMESSEQQDSKTSTVKVCKNCGQEKELASRYYKSPGTKDGYDSACRQCRSDQAKERVAKRKSEIAEYNEQRDSSIPDPEVYVDPLDSVQKPEPDPPTPLETVKKHMQELSKVPLIDPEPTQSNYLVVLLEKRKSELTDELKHIEQLLTIYKYKS